MNENGYSLSDLATITDKNGFGGEGMWVILLIILLFGGNGFGWNNRNGEFGQYATAASQNELLLGQKFDALSRQINQVGDGLCSSTYALNNSILGEGRALQTQMADSTAAINATTVNQTQKILDALSTNRMADMQNQINALQLENAVSGVVRYPMASTYAMLNNPFCGCGCGCAQ